MAENCKDCANCAKAKKTPEPIPYLVHESAMARMERIIRRLWIAVLVLIVALILSNGAWIYYELQFTEEVQEVTQDVDTGNGNATVTGIGDIYGEGETDSQD